MIGPMVALATTTAPAKPGEYSGFLSICLIVTRPGPAASAMALPLMPENTTLTRMSTWASPPRKPPDEDAAEVEDAFADGAGVHQVGRQDEQRHRQQHVAVVQAVEHLLGGQAHVLPLYRQVGDAAGEHREGHRSTQHHTDGQHPE